MIRRIDSDLLEGLVWDRIMLLAEDKDLLSKGEAAAKADQASLLSVKDVRIRKAETEIKTLQDEMKCIVDEITSPSTPGSLKEQLKRRYTEVETLQNTKKEVLNLIQKEREIVESDRRLLSQKLRLLLKLYNQMDKGEQAELFAAFISRLEVHNDLIVLGLHGGELETITRISESKNPSERGGKTSKAKSLVSGKNGSPTWIRTTNPLINSQMLYR